MEGSKDKKKNNSHEFTNNLFVNSWLLKKLFCYSLVLVFYIMQFNL